VRNACVFALVLAVQAAAVTAPLVHAHVDDHATAHHGARAIHTHWEGHARSHHPSQTQTVESDDHDRPIFLNALVAVAAATLLTPAVAHGVFTLFVPVETAAHRGPDTVRSHDPPFVPSLASRAPPALLS
jgi:hypothetical protein